MLPKVLFAVFSSLVVAAATMDDAGNPGCRMHVREVLGGIWAECYSDGCPNPCTEALAEVPDDGLTHYCPCGSWEDESANLKCLPKLVYADPPVFGAGMPECESLCIGGCDIQEIGFFYAPLCSRCP